MTSAIQTRSTPRSPLRASANFSTRLLAWWDRHGRKDLPWQSQRSAYRVWVAEIMLQQTQVATVIPYYERFLNRFPDVSALAAASLDEVLRLWAGLGYYARARNLHGCARIVAREHKGIFPRHIDALNALPGIGRSTAGAILACAHGKRHPILDGNVKRVLARYHAVTGWPGSREVDERLWRLADRHTPRRRVAAYTQAIMDLGATLCTRTRPRCIECPLVRGCEARKRGETLGFPSPKLRKTNPVRSVRFLIVRDTGGAVLLQARPPAGIWGGLWSLPEIAMDAVAAQWVEQNGFIFVRSFEWPALRHRFSHYDLDIHPLLLDVDTHRDRVMDAGISLWYNGHDALSVGVPAPVRRLLARLGDRE